MENIHIDVDRADKPRNSTSTRISLSPRMKHLKNEMKIEIEREKYDNTWDSCCFSLDKRATLFFSQLFISITVIIFCIYQLLNSSSCETDTLYSGILTLILGVYLPQPKIK